MWQRVADPDAACYRPLVAPNQENDLAGYIVYRRDLATEMQRTRISPAGVPLVAPAFHDAHVEAGHRYAYSVSAVDRDGNEKSSFSRGRRGITAAMNEEYTVKYCRFETNAGPQYGEVIDRAGVLWIERLLPPFEEDPWVKLSTDRFEPLPLETARLLVPVVPTKIVCVGRKLSRSCC